MKGQISRIKKKPPNPFTTEYFLETMPWLTTLPSIKWEEQEFMISQVLLDDNFKIVNLI